MNKEQIESMLLDLLGEIDYDILKNYLKEYAEEPEYVDEAMAKLVKIVKKHLKKVKSK